MIKGMIGVAIDRPVAYGSNPVWKTRQIRGNLNSVMMRPSKAIAELSRRVKSLWACVEIRRRGSSAGVEDRGMIRTCDKSQPNTRGLVTYIVVTQLVSEPTQGHADLMPAMA